jgi:esterase/lipase
MKKIVKSGLTALFLLITISIAVAYLTDQPHLVNLSATYDTTFNTIADVEKWIDEEPLRYPKLKSSAQSEIVWADTSNRVKTPYSIVYIHGFSASKDEGNPVHRNIAKELGMNLYLCRLPQHGLNDTNAFLKLEANDMIATAAQAVDIGKLLGEKVILMGTSTGGTLSLIQAAQRDDIEALILYSPLIDFFDDRTEVFSLPHGTSLAKQILGDDYVRGSKQTELESAIWYQDYNIEGLESLANLVEKGLSPELFAKIKQPLFLGYYYKDEEHQDKTVSVAAMLKMFDQIGTPTQQKIKKVYPESGAHVICSDLKSSSVDEVITDTISFIKSLNTQ